MSISFAFNVNLRIRRKDGTEVSLNGYKLSPIDKAFIYAILDFPMDFFLNELRIEHDILSTDVKFIKNKF